MLSRRPKEDALVPHVHLVANIYGNDPVTREVALQLVDYVVENKQKDQDVAWLLDNARLSVVPSVNVDGSDASIPGECIGMPSYQDQRAARAVKMALPGVLAKHSRLFGVRGTVLNRRSEPIARALLTIHNRTVGFRTNERGEFWRILLPGSYTLLASADGYLPAAVDFQVVSKQATTLEVKLYSGYRYET
ncbi:carboxypeptidase m, putative [Ixodes scapularis]|uniref:Carboxypeptidase m, putative n=1 Tax=Ixodes scapularis TaxID=6945 RepID=B7PDQ1_IXOSC|nr:carboxypeptidase m, putative [Ixodes scapularis]|eukprot:XP_002410995.1 carboxypeptidase m, putative [Ixodes scapularis]